MKKIIAIIAMALAGCGGGSEAGNKDTQAASGVNDTAVHTHHISVPCYASGVETTCDYVVQEVIKQ